MHGGDRTGGGVAIGALPARHQPLGGVEHRRVEARERRTALPRHAAEHRVHQSRVARGAPIRLSEPHREVNRRMVRHVEPEQLCGADEQDGLDPRRVGRKAAVERACEQVPQGAQPAQHGADKLARQRPVPLLQRREGAARLATLKLLVERPVPPQHAVEEIGGDPPGGEAWHLGRSASGSRHERKLVTKCRGGVLVPANLSRETRKCKRGA